MNTSQALPYAKDLLDFFLLVRVGGDDEEAVEQIDGNAVRALIVRAADSTQHNTDRINTYSWNYNATRMHTTCSVTGKMYVHHSPRDATVCGGDEHRRHV